LLKSEGDDQSIAEPTGGLQKWMFLPFSVLGTLRSWRIWEQVSSEGFLPRFEYRVAGTQTGVHRTDDGTHAGAGY
jgi:hypothetical protein